SAMGGTPDITDSYIPDTVLELPDVSHIYPTPIIADLDLVMWTDFDPTATLLKGVHGAGTDHPFPDPFALIGPHRDGALVLPVIDDFQETTGFIAVLFWMRGTWVIGKWRPTRRKLYLNLCQSEQRNEGQDNSQNTAPAKLSK